MTLNPAYSRPRLTKSQLISMTGLTLAAINRWIKRDAIEQPTRSAVYSDDERVWEYVNKKAVEARTAVKPKAGNRNDLVSVRRTVGGAELTEEEKEILENNRRKLEAEMRKLEAAADALELKNKILRGGLGNIEFLESLFFEQMNFAIRQFAGLPQKTMDDIVSMVLEDGKAARTECVNLQNDLINKIGESTKRGWDKNIKRIESELTKLGDS